MKATEHTMPSWDGVELFYRAWQPSEQTDKALLLFHRGHEHSERWQEVVELLRLDGVSVFAWDARGHGRSPGERGSAESLAVIIKDIDAFVRHISRKFSVPIENMVVLGHSVGAVTLAAWVHDYAPRVRAMILGTPAFRVKLYVPLAVPMLRLKQRLLGPGYVKSYVKAKVLTHDPEQAVRYQADSRIFRQIAVNILLDLHDTATRLIADAGAIRVPTLLLAAGSDWVVKVSAQRQFFDGLSSTVKEMEIYSGMFHAIFHEKDRGRVIERVRRFVVERFQTNAPLNSLVGADRQGYTRQEYDRLCRPGSFRFRVIQMGMKTTGRLSKGIQLGWRSGFDSGLTLDYVYANKPQGVTPLGRVIDRSYLNSIGWRGIRMRKVHLEKMLRAAIERTHAEGRPVRIVDIACGAGRYVLEVLNSLRQISASALLRDYKTENVEAVARLARDLGLASVTALQGDAFDRKSLASIVPRPTIAIVSGLYELFPDNAPVLNSLRGLAEALEPQGCLLYTNQPWHPQVEFIARVLTNREGKPWIMRRRTQSEMDELVCEAGFEKTEMEIDPWGIFTVSEARRTAA
jgi:alpha-beta hydrolase superfamily lysophospholipase